MLLYRILFFVIFTASLASCGYQMGSLTPAHIKTVAVPIFENQTLYRSFEFPLTQSVIQKIQTNTNLRVRTVEKAETILIGKITKITQKTIAQNEQRLATQLDVRMAVEIEWKNQNGKILLPKQVLFETVEVFVERGDTFEKAIMEKGIENIAQLVVYAMELKPFTDP